MVFLPLETPMGRMGLVRHENRLNRALQGLVAPQFLILDELGEVFNDPVLATADLDRLLHHVTILNIKSESYRLRE